MTRRLTLSRALLRLRPERGWTAAYLTHQLVADLFGEREDRGYLYRVTCDRPGGAEVLVLSQNEPLPPDRLPVRDWGAALDVRSKPFAPRLAAGQLLDFEILINAATVVTDPVTGKKRRRDAWESVWQEDRDTSSTPHEVYGAYLARKLANVAELLPQGAENGTGMRARVTERGEIQARRGDRREPIRLVATNLIGTLQVTNAEGLFEVIGQGIGRAKAFGCGLLCLSLPGTILARRARSAEV